jgi:hypothetical protein
MKIEASQLSLLQQIRTAMVAAGIDQITVHYEGSGDDGNIETIDAFAADSTLIDLDVMGSFEVLVPEWDPEAKDYKDAVAVQPAREAIEQLVNGLIDQNGHGGWENNDGGYGDITLTQAGIEWEHGDYYTEVAMTDHAFSFDDAAADNEAATADESP